MMFRKLDGKTYLRVPFERDIDANIPVSIREHCVPMDITEDLPREKNEATGAWQTPSDTIRILGVRLNLDSTPGMEMWKKIERILDRGTSRDQKIPVPAVVAPNQKDPFSLEASDIPVVILKKEILVSSDVEVSEPVDIVVPQSFTCGVCQKSFPAQRSLWMHERKTRHKVKEPVVAA
jgi:protein-disulfide isomerase